MQWQALFPISEKECCGVNEKIVIITGGSSGYGFALAEEFKRKGYRVIITARNEERLLKAKEECGADDAYVMDVTRYEDWVLLKEFAVRKYGKIDVMINNAGGGVAIQDVDEFSQKQIDETVALNLTSVIYSGNVMGALMKEQRDGVIINISSVCAKHCWNKWSVYAAAKAGVLNFSKGLYVELRPYGIRVTCVIPAAAKTGFQSAAGIAEETAVLSPADVAKSVLYAAELPKTAVIEELTVWGTSQEVNPL